MRTSSGRTQCRSYNRRKWHYLRFPHPAIRADKSRVSNLIGTGVVVHVPTFFKELRDLEKKGLKNVRERILISDRAQCCLDLHSVVDGLEEVELGGKSIGTTKKGIGPAYSTKAARSGIRMSEIFNKEIFDGKLKELARSYKKRYGDLLQYDVENEIKVFDVSHPRPLEDTCYFFH